MLTALVQRLVTGQRGAECGVDVQPGLVVNVRVRLEDGHQIRRCVAKGHERFPHVSHKDRVVLDHPDVPATPRRGTLSECLAMVGWARAPHLGGPI